MYEAGELSRMIVSAIGLPSWERSCWDVVRDDQQTGKTLIYLDIIALVVVAALPEQSMSDDAMDIEFIKHRISILVGAKVNTATKKRKNGTNLAKTGSKDDNLIQFTHLFHKVVNTRALQDVEMMPVGFNFDRNNKVRRVDRL